MPHVRVGRRVVLRHVESRDYSRLHEIAQSGTSALRWRLRARTPSLEQFSQEMWTASLAQLVVSSRLDPRVPIGLVSAYNVDLRNGHCQFAIVMATTAPTPLSIEASVLFLIYLFENWPLIKIYAEANEHSFPSFSAGENRLFHVEGRMPRHEFLDGGYVDGFLLGFYEEMVRTYADQWLPWAASSGLVEP